MGAKARNARSCETCAWLKTSAAGTVGSIVPAGLAAGDGFGGTFCTADTAALYIWRVGGAGTCVMNRTAEVWR